MAAGTVSDTLYVEDGQGNKAPLGDPPAPPSPVPPPVRVEVVNQPAKARRMADETPDGRIRDTSTEALRPGNDLNFRQIDPDPKEAIPPAASEQPAASNQPAAEQPEPAKAPGPPKIYAGKFKTAEDLEKSYQELEKTYTKTAQEAATLRAAQQAKPVEPAAPVIKTPEQVAAEQAENNRILQDFVSNPKDYIEKNVVQRITTALTAQQLVEQWRKSNPDIAEHEVRVAFEANLLAQADPELARNPAALFTKATDNFRAFTGKIRSEGAKEALTQETRTIPLLSNTAPAAATEQPSPKAPLTADQSYDLTMRMLKEQEQRSHRGLRR